ncbi:MAG TPA: histidinol-phosphatase HisJ [Candidatus Lokiarchaeia archaeon]
MIKLQDWHTHNLMCHHAVGSFKDYIKKAIELNLDTIGLSDHFPYDYLEGLEGIPIEEYSMNLKEVEFYISKTEELKKKYRKKINVRIGFEIDFIENQINNLNIYLNKFKPRLDYILGSVHILFSETGPWAMDDSRYLEKYNSIGTDNVFLKYYQIIRKMINSADFDFDIVSHFDLPKKFNKIPSSSDEIINEINKTLECVKKRHLAIEINSSGLRKEVKEQYPSENIIETMYELDIPILLGSDAHDPTELAYDFNKIIKLLKDIGYNQLVAFNKRKPSFLEF